MAFSCVVGLALFGVFAPCLFVRGYDDCQAYTDISGKYHSAKSCSTFCCGSCNNRYCCQDIFWKLS